MNDMEEKMSADVYEEKLMHPKTVETFFRLMNTKKLATRFAKSTDEKRKQSERIRAKQQTQKSMRHF